MLDKIFVDKILEIIRSASEIFKGNGRANIEEKGEYDYVTDTDTSVQEYIKGHLASLAPDVGFMGEENGEGVFYADRDMWILDPVDGTTNLICDLKASAISLALSRKGTVTFGVIYNPYLDEMFYAVKGEGAYLNGKKISVSSKTSPKQCAIAIGTAPYTRALGDRTFNLARRIFDNCIDIRRFGAASLDLAYTACGRFGAFAELSLKPWDFAAGKLLIEEAGGVVTDISGNELSLYGGTSILAGAKSIHKELLILLSDI